MNVQEWVCFSIFWRADDVTRTMSKGCVLHPLPLSGNPVSAPVYYRIRLKPARALTPTHTTTTSSVYLGDIQGYHSPGVVREISRYHNR